MKVKQNNHIFNAILNKCEVSIDNDSESEEDVASTSSKKFNDISFQDMKAFISIFIIMELNSSTDLRDYWKEDGTDSGKAFLFLVCHL